MDSNFGSDNALFSPGPRREKRPRLAERAQALRRANPEAVRRDAEAVAKARGFFELHVALRSAAEKLKEKIDAAEASGNGYADLGELAPNEQGEVNLGFLAENPEVGLAGISDGTYKVEAEARQRGKKKEIRDVEEINPKIKSEILESANDEYDALVAEDAQFETKARSNFGWVRQGAWENRKKLEAAKKKNKEAENGDAFMDIVGLEGFNALDEQLARLDLRLELHREGDVWKVRAQGIEEEQQVEHVAAAPDRAGDLLANAELPEAGPERDRALLALGEQAARRLIADEAARIAEEEAAERRIRDMEEKIEALGAQNAELAQALKESKADLEKANDRLHQHQRDVMVALLNKVGMDPRLADGPLANGDAARS